MSISIVEYTTEESNFLDLYLQHHRLITEIIIIIFKRLIFFRFHGFFDRARYHFTTLNLDCINFRYTLILFIGYFLFFASAISLGQWKTKENYIGDPNFSESLPIMFITMVTVFKGKFFKREISENEWMSQNQYFSFTEQDDRESKEKKQKNWTS